MSAADKATFRHSMGIPQHGRTVCRSKGSFFTSGGTAGASSVRGVVVAYVILHSQIEHIPYPVASLVLQLGSCQHDVDAGGIYRANLPQTLRTRHQHVTIRLAPTQQQQVLQQQADGMVRRQYICFEHGSFDLLAVLHTHTMELLQRGAPHLARFVGKHPTEQRQRVIERQRTELLFVDDD